MAKGISVFLVLSCYVIQAECTCSGYYVIFNETSDFNYQLANLKTIQRLREESPDNYSFLDTDACILDLTCDAGIKTKCEDSFTNNKDMEPSNITEVIATSPKSDSVEATHNSTLQARGNESSAEIFNHAEPVSVPRLGYMLGSGLILISTVLTIYYYSQARKKRMDRETSDASPGSQEMGLIRTDSSYF